MSPTCSSRFLVGRNTRSAVARTIGIKCAITVLAYRKPADHRSLTVLSHPHSAVACSRAAELDLTVDRASGTARRPARRAASERRCRTARSAPGDRLPSVRELADVAGVNVNTARAVYARLESEGLVRSEQGRGTFVAAQGSAGGAATRRELHRQIAELEAALVRLPPPPLSPEGSGHTAARAAALLSTEDLEAVRDRLVARLARARRAARGRAPAARAARGRGRGARRPRRSRTRRRAAPHRALRGPGSAGSAPRPTGSTPPTPFLPGAMTRSK